MLFNGINYDLSEIDKPLVVLATKIIEDTDIDLVNKNIKILCSKLKDAEHSLTKCKVLAMFHVWMCNNSLDDSFKKDVIEKCSVILNNVEFIENNSAESVKAYREKLENKIKELIGDNTVDEQRLLTETAIFADKIAVDEETVRLKSHVGQVQSLFESNEPIGRKLDFIVQEMNRETNTIGSKCNDIAISQKVVEMKSIIEKIREQIQNIE